MFDPTKTFLQLDHDDSYMGAVAHTIRICALLASGQPVANSDPAQSPWFNLTGDQLFVFYDELKKCVRCRLRRYPHQRKLWLETISTFEKLPIFSIFVSTSSNTELGRTTVHANLLALPDAGEVAAATIAYHERQRGAFWARHGLVPQKPAAA